MATYTGVADANGDFNIPFGSNSYTSGEKITITAEKDSAIKSIELFAPSEVTGGGVIQFAGELLSFPENIGEVTISGIDGPIGGYAFQSGNVSSIWAKASGLNISNGVTSIGQFAFSTWSNALKLTLPNTLISIGSSAFYTWTKVNTELILPPQLVDIGDSAFRGWSKATSLTIPSSVKSLNGERIFQDWSLATSLNLNFGGTTIPRYCFLGWSLCTRLTIPANVTFIAAGAFFGWASCTEITCLNTTPPTIQADTFSNLNASCVFRVPAGSVAAYQAAPNWSAFASRIQAI